MKETMKSIMIIDKNIKKCVIRQKKPPEFSIKKMVDGHTKIYDDI